MVVTPLRIRRALPFVLFLSVFLVLLVPAAVGDDARNEHENPWSLQLGLGTRVAPLYAGSSTYGITAFPFLRISYNDRYFLGPRGLKARLHDTDAYEIEVGLVYNFGRDDVEESDIGGARDAHLRGLGDVDGAVGNRITFSTRGLPVTLEGSLTKYWGTDLDGVQASLGARKAIPVLSNLVLIPGAGLEWADRGYRETFFGISRVQASRTSFDRFRPGAGFNRVRGGLGARAFLSSRWSFRAGVRVQKLLGEVARSPVTREETSVSFLSGLLYRF